MLRYLREYFTSGIDYITVTHGSDPGNERRKLTFWLSDSCCRHMVITPNAHNVSPKTNADARYW